MASSSEHQQVESFTYFYRKQSPFSQWHDSLFTGKTLFPIDDKDDEIHEFANCEQWMMYNKAMLFNDQQSATKILRVSDPRSCKGMGRRVKNFVETIWNEHREKIVYEGNKLKFTQNKDLLQKLLATQGSTLVEASPVDRIWGIGLKESDPRAKSRKTWKGANLLGEILTKLRDDLIQEQNTK